MKWILLSTTVLLSNILLTEQVTYQQKQAYLRKLLHLQQKMEDRIEIIRQITENTLINSQSLKGQPDLQKTILQEGIKSERDHLESAFHETLIPLKENYWTCKSLSNSQKDLIAAKIKDLKDKTDSINRQIPGENDCVRNVQLKAQLRFLKLHIESLENQLSNVCQPPRKDDKLINNLDTSKDWIYGSLTSKDYQKQLDDLEQKYNLIQCEKDKPFLINNECSACSKSQQKFSLSEKKCIDKCPNGTVFLKLNHNCVDPKKTVFIPQSLDNVDGSQNPYIWGPITQQQYKDQIQQLKNNNIPVSECPADKPFNQNGEKCTSCSSGQVFNVGTKQCTNCENQQKYIQKTHECKQVYKKPNYDAGKNWVAVNGDSKPIDNKLKDLQNQNYPVELCPSDKPFPTKDLTQCVACDKNYNVNTGSCEECNKYFEVKTGEHECKYVTKDCGSNEFWNGEKCLKCVKPGVYDNNFRSCACEYPLKYDTESGQCLAGASHQKNPNPQKANNFVGTAPSPSKFLDSCPDSKPFYDQKLQDCIECSLPSKYYNYDNKKCEQCDKNLQFSTDQKKCAQPVAILNSNIGPNINNYCCGQPSNIQGKQNCPEDRPFFDGYHCVSCQKPKYFDFKDKQCKSCPSGKEFSGLKKQCIDESLVKPKIVSNIPSGTNNYFGNLPTDKPDSEGQQIIKCPQEKPFSNGKECLSCSKPRYFNFQSTQCEICKEGYSFSEDSRECQRNTLVGKDIYNSNMINAENFVGRVPDYKSQYPECPSNKRYFNGAECEKCELPYFWNFDKNDCHECDKGLNFDKQARQCHYESGQQKYKTNIDATKNIYYNGDFEDVKKEVSSSGKTVCPSDKPFFDKSTNECMNCNGDSYIFNFAKNHCMKCPDGTHFNEEYHICFQNGVGPTIERMVMNSVSWI